MLNHGLENRNYVNLPEGVAIAITPSGLVARSYAYIIDFLLRGIALLLVYILFSLLGNVGEGLILVTYFFVSWGYNIVYEAKKGQTPGKKRLKIRVVQDNGLPASFSQIVVRNLLRPADILPVGYFLGLIVMLFNSRFKRIGDWAAGTCVIYDDDFIQRSLLSKGDSEVPKIAFTTEEQLAVLSFAERSQELSDERCRELANILVEPLGGDESQTETILYNYARFFAGNTQADIPEENPRWEAKP